MNPRKRFILVFWGFLSLQVALVWSARRAETKVENGDECVSGYCLPPDYNKLELPQNVTQVGINAEVRKRDDWVS